MIVHSPGERGRARGFWASPEAELFIIRIGGPELKPEADPGWEERKAKKARLVSPGSTSSLSHFGGTMGRSRRWSVLISTKALGSSRHGSSS